MVFLTSCATKSRTKEFSPVTTLDLSAFNAYQFSGKMSFSDGQDGGSGSIKWQQKSGRIDATLKAPLGSKSWQIIESGSHAKLVNHQGEIFTGESTAELLSGQLGWLIPWEQLIDWVQGRPHDTDQAQVQWLGDTFLINENGWQITYSKLKTYEKGVLPHKMMAKNGDYSIKLVVKKWSW